MKTRRHAVALLSGIIIAVALSMVPAATLWADSPKAVPLPPPSMADVQSAYGHLPLSFEANQGQTDRQVKFLSRGQGYNLFLTSTEAVLALTSLDRAMVKGSEVEDSRSSKETRQAVLRMGLVGANPAQTISGLDALLGKANYFIGNDPQHWRTNVPTYVKVQYKDVYPGIDLVYYGNQRQLEYDFIVAPGADLTAITLAFDGADQLAVDGKGDLVLQFGDSDLRLQKPLVYQMVNGAKQQIPGNYRLEGQHQISFQVAAYDRSKPLVIDPTLFYSTYLGGNGNEESFGIAVDSAMNAYITGTTSSLNFPTTAGAFRTMPAGAKEIFITKLNPTGSGLVYSTYLGGSNDEQGRSIAADTLGNAYVTGWTASNDFPTVNAFQPTFAGGVGIFGVIDAFVVKLNATGSSLVYSSYLGGSGSCGWGGDVGFGIAVDLSGSAYVAGTTLSDNFPTQNAFQPMKGGGPCAGDEDAFISKLSPLGNSLIYSTYLGGDTADGATGIAVDPFGNVSVGGYTRSANFPTFNAVQPTLNGERHVSVDGWVAKLNATGSALIYSTYLGGTQFDAVNGVATDTLGNGYVTGGTSSTDFPTANALYPTHSSASSGGEEVFVTKFSPSGGFVYSTYLGSGRGHGIAADFLGNAYVTGFTFSTIFPTANPIMTEPGDGHADAWVTKLNSSGSSLLYSTYLGGNNYDEGRAIAVDSFANAYVTGLTFSSNFPTTTGAFQTTLAGGNDVFVAKIIDVTLPPATAGKVTGGGTVDVPGGVGNFGFIVQRKDAAGPITGNLNYHNKASGAKIKDSSFTIFAISGNMAVFEGTCTNNGASCTFRVTVTDNGEPGDTDEFTISISGGAEEGGTLRSGNIQIH